MLDQVKEGCFIGQARESQLTIDRLPEQGGSGEGFRPTELLLLALGSCMMGTLWTFAENQKIPVQGIHLELTSEELPHPERVGRIEVRMEVEGDILPKDRERLMRVAQHCKIHNTLKRPPEISASWVGPTSENLGTTTGYAAKGGQDG
jgi:uncharacterized OsmC-like protein